MAKTERQCDGQSAERRARDKLETAGLRTLAQNWSCRVGELDLVMRDGDLIVVVEVRYRRRADFGGALESIDARKQRRIARATSAWLQRHRRDDPPVRFDVVTVDGAGRIEWLRDAFELEQTR